MHAWQYLLAFAISNRGFTLCMAQILASAGKGQHERRSGQQEVVNEAIPCTRMQQRTIDAQFSFLLSYWLIRLYPSQARGKADPWPPKRSTCELTSYESSLEHLAVAAAIATAWSVTAAILLRDHHLQNDSRALQGAAERLSAPPHLLPRPTRLARLFLQWWTTDQS